MILYEVTWDNGECFENNLTSNLIFTTLEKAKEYYNKNILQVVIVMVRKLLLFILLNLI